MISDGKEQVHTVLDGCLDQVQSNYWKYIKVKVILSFLSTVVLSSKHVKFHFKWLTKYQQICRICQPGDHVLIGKGDDIYLPASVNDTLQVGQIKCFCFC